MPSQAGKCKSPCPLCRLALHNKSGKETGITMVHIKTHNAPANHFFIHPRARSTHHLIPNDGKSAGQNDSDKPN